MFDALTSVSCLVFNAVIPANHPAGTINQSFNVLLLEPFHCGI
jgi:hypothetical protein